MVDLARPGTGRIHRKPSPEHLELLGTDPGSLTRRASGLARRSCTRDQLLQVRRTPVPIIFVFVIVPLGDPTCSWPGLLT